MIDFIDYLVLIDKLLMSKYSHSGNWMISNMAISQSPSTYSVSGGVSVPASRQGVSLVSRLGRGTVSGPSPRSKESILMERHSYFTK